MPLTRFSRWVLAALLLLALLSSCGGRVEPPVGENALPCPALTQVFANVADAIREDKSFRVEIQQEFTQVVPATEPDLVTESYRLYVLDSDSWTTAESSPTDADVLWTLADGGYVMFGRSTDVGLWPRVWRSSGKGVPRELTDEVLGGVATISACRRGDISDIADGKVTVKSPRFSPAGQFHLSVAMDDTSVAEIRQQFEGRNVCDESDAACMDQT